jgi:hypothetical protein
MSTDQDGDPLKHYWYLNGKVVSEEKDYLTKLSEGDHTVGLTVSDGEFEDEVIKDVTVEVDQIYPLNELDVLVRACVTRAR